LPVQRLSRGLKNNEVFEKFPSGFSSAQNAVIDGSPPLWYHTVRKCTPNS